ncbi:hypothetical protein [Amycolatopsis panacis]|uniref:Uncharacterized protein n=1 Tax=Amycolatopsis panacis TaxID=2340917 RepID=A0A419I0B9_9PSEU|nr:hypothetical protein [Amycolatopsis panacis]RJQ83045.1 hypothetical protein D5S19_20430 [Amycolatopsis panacis]
MTASARPSTVTVELHPEFNHFGLVDADAENPGPAVHAADHVPFAARGPAGALFFTQRDAIVSVRLEVWDLEPPKTAEEFAHRFSGTFTTGTGCVALGSVTASPADRTIDLSPKTTHHLRAYRSATFDAPPDPDVSDTGAIKLQRWLIQV